jgi:polysaccharide export outer membrane protein
MIRSGDEVVVTVADQPSLSGPAQVTDDGNVVLPVVGAVPVAGQTIEAAERSISARLHRIVVSPQVRVVLAQQDAPAVGVLGEVRAPGYHELDANCGMLDALARSGGLTEFADLDGIFLLRRGDPPLRIRFTYRDLVAGEVKSNAIRLQDGDIVVVE